MAQPKRFSALRSWLKGTAADAEDPPAEDPPAEDAEDPPAEDPPAGKADATHAQYRHGVTAERRRWAQVLSSDAAEHRVEAATGLLVEDLSAERIIGMLPRMPKDANTAALALLAKAPKHQLRGPASDEGGKDAGAESRKRAVARHNRSVRGGVKAGAKPRRKADQGEEE